VSRVHAVSIGERGEEELVSVWGGKVGKEEVFVRSPNVAWCCVVHGSSRERERSSIKL
jgi:hypothetical protein